MRPPPPPTPPPRWAFESFADAAARETRDSDAAAGELFSVPNPLRQGKTPSAAPGDGAAKAATRSKVGARANDARSKAAAPTKGAAIGADAFSVVNPLKARS
jgi:hypothetical protein